MMNLEILREIALSHPGVTEDIKWENHLCFNIGGKMFLITNPDGVPVTASFKASDHVFTDLQRIPGVIPAPYLARYKWLHIDDISRLSAEEWKNLVAEAYRLIFEKLPLKIRTGLAI